MPPGADAPSPTEVGDTEPPDGPNADAATEAPTNVDAASEAATDLGEMTECEDVPTPPLLAKLKKEPMSPNAMEKDMRAQMAAMVQATLWRECKAME